MMNKKGQVLVTFIILLPLIFIFLGFAIDIGNSLIIRRKNENTVKNILIYAFKEKDLVNLDLIEKNVKKNINNYEEVKINQNENIIEVYVKSSYKSIFTSIFDIGLNKIEIKIDYDINTQKITREEVN